MKPLKLLLGPILAFTLLDIAAALTVPVESDSSSVVGNRGVPILTAGTGKAAQLNVGPNQTAFIRFQASSYLGMRASDVERAWLMVFVPTVSKQGSLSVHEVLDDWSEALGGNTAAPQISTVAAATISSESVVAKQFLMVDVTALVKSWLSTPAPDFGVAIVSDGVARLQIGAKEGPGKGQSCFLQIEKTAGIHAGEDLSMVRGTVHLEDDTLSIAGGTGFTISQLEGVTGRDFTITFSTPFSAPPTITVTPQIFGDSVTILSVSNVTATGATIRDFGFIDPGRAHFIAIGPR